METETLVALSGMSWVGIAKVFVIFALGGGLWYFAKKYLDLQEILPILVKLGLFELKAEQSVAGAARGEVRLGAVVDMAERVLTNEELLVLKKRGGIRGVAQSVFCVIKGILPYLVKKSMK